MWLASQVWSPKAAAKPAATGRPRSAQHVSCRPWVHTASTGSECGVSPGDRFAGNLLVLPYGLYFGRLDAAGARGVARLLAAGEVDLDHLRGRSGLAMPLQAAEIALRRYVDERRLGTVRFVSRQADGGRTDAVFDVSGRRYAVRVTTSKGSDLQRLTCSALRDNPVVHHVVDDIRAV